jgi:hypothetical protein
MNTRQARQRALEEQIARIGRQIERLGALSQRFSWYRLGILILGGVFTWLVWEALGAGGHCCSFCPASPLLLSFTGGWMPE